MVKIRLKRMGTTKRPVYRLVVADSRSPRDGRFIEAIGFYDPLPEPAVVRIDEDKVRVWMRRGARPSDSARDLLVRQGILAAPPRVQRPAKPAREEAPAPVSASATPTVEPAAAEPRGESADAVDAAADSDATEQEPACATQAEDEAP